jgi:hypothetical protein
MIPNATDTEMIPSVRQNSLEVAEDISPNAQVHAHAFTDARFEGEQSTEEEKREHERIEWHKWLQFENYDE